MAASDLAGMIASITTVFFFFASIVGFLIVSYIKNVMGTHYKEMQAQFMPRTELELRLKALEKNDD